MTSESTTKIILPESPEAAQLVTESFWKSRNGRYYDLGDENVARRDGATHVHCSDCGQPCDKTGIVCPECQSKRDRARWLAMERKLWDGTTPICIMGTEVYFFDESTLDDYCEDEDIKPADLLLVHCQPAKPRLLDIRDWLDDCLPEDEDYVPPAIAGAAEALNAVLRAMPPMVWYEGSIAVEWEQP